MFQKEFFLLYIHTLFLDISLTLVWLWILSYMNNIAAQEHTHRCLSVFTFG